MNSLDRDIRSAQAEPPQWTDDQADAVWARIDAARATPRQPAERGFARGWNPIPTLVAVAAVLALVFVGWARWSPTGNPRLARGILPISELPRSPRPALRTDDDERGPPPSVPEDTSVPREAPGPLVELTAHDVVALAPTSTRYRADDDWTGTLEVGEGITISGAGASFDVERVDDTVVVTPLASRVHVAIGGQRTALGPGESIEIGLIDVARRAPPSKTKRSESAASLLARADEARLSGQLAEAARVLRTFVRHHPRHRERATALFQLGKVERKRGRHAASARAFAKSRAAHRGKPLESDALAEEARSWHKAGKKRDAQARAREYLNRKPSGIHASDMRAVLSADP